MIRVGVSGACGHMGRNVCEAVEAAEDMVLAGRADPALNTTIADMVADIDVLVDFTIPTEALKNVEIAIDSGKHVVLGTTGYDQWRLYELVQSAKSNVFVAPNFAIGAVLMMRFAAEAAQHMSRGEIVEVHHMHKLDAPSGTAALTAKLMAEASNSDAPDIHSARLPGVVANQQVILGDIGQTLSIEHRTIDRTSFMPGVLLAIRKVAELDDRLTVGLDKLLWPQATPISNT